MVLLANPGQASAGELTISFDTSPAGGSYAPRNIVAVWVETVTRGYIKTLGRWSDVRTSYLISWGMASNSDIDVVSGATRPNHTETLQVVWDTADDAGNLVVPGTYRIRMELADDNSGTPDDNNQGTFTFQIDGVARVETPADSGGFSNVVLDYSGGPVGEPDPSDPNPDPNDPNDPNDPDPDPDGSEPELGTAYGCGVGGTGGGLGLGLLVLALAAFRRRR